MNTTTNITARPTTVTLADGTYTWTAVTAWAGQPMRAVVTAGRITAWDYVAIDGSGEIFPAVTGAELERRNADLMAILLHEVSEGYRLGGLIKLVEFVPAPEAPAAPRVTLGKARAHRLHIIMGKLRIPNHYQFATEVLDLAFPVTSLAELTEAEALTVWQALAERFPVAHRIAQAVAA